MTSSRPRRVSMRATPFEHHVGQAACRTGRQRLGVERVAQVMRGHTLDRVVDGQQRDDVPGSSLEDQRPRAVGRAHPPDGRAAVEDGDIDAVETRMGEQPHVGQLVVDARAPERAQQPDPGRAPVERGQEAQLGVALVLVGIGADDRGTRRHQLVEVGRRERVQVANDEVHVDARQQRPPRTAVRADDEVTGLDRVTQGGVVDTAIGHDDHALCLHPDGRPPMPTGGRDGDRVLDSLRRYEPDQVPRVCGHAALSAPGGAPLSLCCCAAHGTPSRPGGSAGARC